MAKDKIIRCITSDGTIMAAAIDSGNIVHTAQCVHKTSPVATAALGRLLTASSIMGAMLKKKEATVSLKINGGGPLGNVCALADSDGNCRGFVEHPEVEMPLRGDGKLDVGGAVGTDGLLHVMRDFGDGSTPYTGSTEILTGEIAEDITAYYARSEQIPTVCALGVLLDKEDHKVLLAGGLLIQALPTATDEELEKLENNIRNMESVTTMLAKGMDILSICKKALDGFEVEVLDEFDVAYTCTCSKERLVRALCTIPPEEIVTLADEETGYMEANCQYCGKQYRFSKAELSAIANRIVENRKKRENEDA
jgi:molecular chaperone Hsp33